MDSGSDFEGRITIVTGGTSGIGRAASRALAERGCRVAVADVHESPRPNADDARPTVRMIEEDVDGDAVFVNCDVTDEADVDALFDRTDEEYGGLDILVNSAAVAPMGTVTETSREEWERTLAVNLTGTFNTCRRAIETFLEADDPSGAIVNLSSTWGLVAGKEVAAYSASKGGVELFTKQLAVDFATDGIRANTVVPGWTETPLTRPLIEDDAQREAMLSDIPMDRFGQPSEVAEAIVFLASDRASYVTGHSFEVNGGFTAW